MTRKRINYGIGPAVILPPIPAFWKGKPMHILRLNTILKNAGMPTL